MDCYNKFINTFRAAGKTFCIRQQAKYEMNLGKRVAIVCWFPQTYFEKIYKKVKLYAAPEQGVIHVYKASNVLKYLEPFNCEDLYWKELPCFKEYDHLYVDPDCYELIIYALQKQNFELKQKINKNTQKLRSIIDDFERE